MDLPKQQRATFEALARRYRAERRYPAPHELRDELGVDRPRVHRLLEALAAKGLLDFDSLGRGKAPHLALTPAGFRLAGLGVPVVGVIRGGPMGEAIMEPMGHLDLPARPNVFALRVVGDSMATEILEGDLVLLEAGVEPRAGETCAVRVNGYDATLKRFLPDPGRGVALLEPNNPRHRPIEADLDGLHIDGVFRALLRGDLRGLYVEDPAV